MEQLRHVMVGIDFSPRSVAAVQVALTLAKPADATVELVHVVETHVSSDDATVLGISSTDLVDMLLNEARVTLETLAAQLPYEKLHQTVLSGSAARELALHAEKRETDLLVIGDTGAGSTGSPIGVGVTAYRLVERGPRHVLVVKAGHSGKIKTVAAAISFMPVADDVMHEAHLIARLSGAELRVVHVIPDITELRYKMAILPGERLLSDSVQHNERRLQEYLGHFQLHDVVLKAEVLLGKSGSVLVDYLQKEDIDIVVMGTGTSYRIAGYPIGSNTHRVLTQSLASVCVVRSLEPAP
ncbi:MAG: universal stress protein [Armatimonadota bacterium]